MLIIALGEGNIHNNAGKRFTTGKLYIATAVDVEINEDYVLGKESHFDYVMLKNGPV